MRVFLGYRLQAAEKVIRSYLPRPVAEMCLDCKQESDANTWAVFSVPGSDMWRVVDPRGIEYFVTWHQGMPITCTCSYYWQLRLICEHVFAVLGVRPELHLTESNFHAIWLHRYGQPRPPLPPDFIAILPELPARVHTDGVEGLNGSAPAMLSRRIDGDGASEIAQFSDIEDGSRRLLPIEMTRLRARLFGKLKEVNRVAQGARGDSLSKQERLLRCALRGAKDLLEVLKHEAEADSDSDADVPPSESPRHLR